MNPISSDSAQTRVKLPPLAVIAAVIAFLLVLSGLLNAFRHVVYLVVAAVPAMAGITILRRHSWGAYGFALFEATQSVVLPALLLRESSIPPSQIVSLVVWGLILAVVFFLAGRSLSAAGAGPGSSWPWIAITLLATVPFVFLRPYVMPSGSMENTLLIGDRILVRVFPRPTPVRGDLVVFRYPIDPKQVMIKRVIGIPGDRVRMVSRIIYLNGVALPESYTIHVFPADAARDNLAGNSSDLASYLGQAETIARAKMLKDHSAGADILVPANKYFVLGDNRDNSLDSRYWGFVNISEIIGKPVLIYDSETPAEKSSASPSRTHTRWERIFRVL